MYLLYTGGDFSKALQKVLVDYTPDRVIIEPSGVGKLSDVVKAIEGVKDEADIEIDGRITVVDGKKAKIYLKNFGEFFNNQVEHASTIVISRTQMMTDEKVEECVHTLREENAEATQMSHEDNAATTQMSHEEMQKKLKKQRIRQIIASLIGVAILVSDSGRLSVSSWIIMPTKPATMPR